VSEYVLTLHASDDAPNDSAPMTLSEVGIAACIATHRTGFDISPFVMNGNQIDPADSLTKDGLMDSPTQEFVGSTLWERLASGAIGTELRKHIGTSRLYLDLRSKSLDDYPWELLQDDQGFHLSTAAQICLGRPIPSPGPFTGQPPEADHPLRVLVVVGSDPDDKNIKADEELVAIEAAAHARNDQVLLRALIRPAPGTIEADLKEFRPHVLHFIGHGSRDIQDKPQIDVYNAANGQKDSWRASGIRDVFRQSPPRLVVLNACLTSGAPTASTSLVEAFLNAGSIAVVTMMGEIRGDAAVALSKQFYESLFAGQAVDRALVSARLTVKDLAVGEGDQPHDPELRSNWPLPRLMVRGDIETAVTMTRSQSQSLPGLPKDDFVGRWNERWQVSQSMDGTHSRLALVSGRQAVGKTELLNTIAATCARHGEQVLMVNLGGASTGTWQDVLRKIAEAAKKAGLSADLLTEIADEAGQSGTVITKFQAELARSAGPGGLLIMLDGLSDWEDNIVRATVLPELCGPYLLTTAPPPVRMIITTDKNWNDVWDRLPAGWQPIKVDQFPEEEWKRAMAHFEAYWTSQVPQQERAGFVTVTQALRAAGNRTGATLQFVRGEAMRRIPG
jgi:hypothetical protein